MNALADLTQQLARHAAERDRTGQWPVTELEILEAAGAWRWMIPRRWGGDALATGRILANYRRVAAGSVAVALVLTQRDGAVDLIARADDAAIPNRYLPALASGQAFTSIGISQITTSRGSSGAKLRATSDADGFRLEGFMPWVSGAPACDYVVTAAVLDDGRPLVACVHCDQVGVTVEPPLELLALQASHTSRVRCEGVRIGRDQLVRSPRPDALSGRAPVKPLTVSAVGMGLADAIVAELAGLDSQLSSELRAAVEPLLRRYRYVEEHFHRVVAAADNNESSPASNRARTPSPDAKMVSAQGDRSGISPADVRVEINDLLARLAVVLMNMSKGSGFLRGRPAERFVREAMFFQVWSSPPVVQAATIAALTPAASSQCASS